MGASYMTLTEPLHTIKECETLVKRWLRIRIGQRAIYAWTEKGRLVGGRRVILKKIKNGDAGKVYIRHSELREFCKLLNPEMMRLNYRKIQ